jgi:P-type Cu2+ transporter
MTAEHPHHSGLVKGDARQEPHHTVDHQAPSRPHDSHGQDDHGSHGDHGDHGDHGGHGDHAAMFRDRFWLTLVLTVPVVYYSEHLRHWFGYGVWEFPGNELLSPVLGTVIFLYGGWPFLTDGLAEARRRKPGMMLLIAMAITVAYTASLATSLGLFTVEVWWELALLIAIMLLGHWLEMRAIGQARGALAALADLLPDDAERVTDDASTERVKIDDLDVGDVVLVRPGGRVPADGTIVEGAAELDESMITGEANPVPRGEGDRVVAATVATDSAIRVRVDAVGDDTTLAGIQRMVAEAQESSSRTQVLADRAAALLFYVAIVAGVITVLTWSLLGQPDAAVVRAVTVLIIACPHALGLAIPRRVYLDVEVGEVRDPREGSPRARTDAHRRRRPVRQDRHPHARRARPHRRRRRRRGHRPAPRHRRRGRSRQRAPARPRHRRRRP